MNLKVVVTVFGHGGEAVRLGIEEAPSEEYPPFLTLAAKTSSFKYRKLL